MYRIRRAQRAGAPPPLDATDVAPACSWWAGLPPNADAVAFDEEGRVLAVSFGWLHASVGCGGRDTALLFFIAPRLLDTHHRHHPLPNHQLATSDGRVAVASASGPETGLPPPTAPPAAPSPRAATAALAPLPGRGQLLRLTAGGDVQLWAAPGCSGDNAAGGLVDALPLTDGATAVAPLPGEPFALLGRASGAVSVLVLTQDASSCDDGIPVSNPSTPARGVCLARYEIPAPATGAGAVTSLLPPSSVSSSTIAITHEHSGVTVWDVRREAATARAARGGDCSTTAAAWAAPDGSLLATGHDDGVVCLWRVPSHPPRRAGVPSNLAPIASLSLASRGGGPPTPIRGIWLAAPDAALVWGGRGGDEPAELTAFDPAAEARTAAADGDAGTPTPPHSGRPLPWFGALRSVALLPPVRGQATVPTCRAVALGDGGSLTVYSLRDGAPSPLAPPLAALPLATAAALAAAPPDSVRREGHDTALLHACTPAAAAVAAAARATVRAPPPLWRDLVGPPPPPPPPTEDACTRLLITGHDDGRLRVWDAGAAGAPALIDVSPWAGGAGGRARARSRPSPRPPQPAWR